MYGIGHLGMGLGALGMTLVWVVPLLLILLFFRRSAGDRRDERRDKTPLDILEERYARGEISREEYLKRRADLEA